MVTYKSIPHRTLGDLNSFKAHVKTSACFLNYCLVSNDQSQSKLKEYLIIHCDWYWIVEILDNCEITEKYFSSFDFILHIKIMFNINAFLQISTRKKGSEGKLANSLCLLEVLLFCISKAYTKITIN